MASRRAASAAEVERFLIGRVAAYARLPAGEVDPDATFESFGLGSRDAVSITGELEEWLNREVPPTLPWEYPTIAALARHLAAAEP